MPQAKAHRTIAPERRARGRRRDLEVVYAYVEGSGTERDYLQGLNEVYGAQLGFHIDVTVNTMSGVTPKGALERAERRLSELRAEARDARRLGDRDRAHGGAAVAAFAEEAQGGLQDQRVGLLLEAVPHLLIMGCLA